MIKPKLIFLFIATILNCSNVYSACGANTRTWEADAGTTNWNTNNNWNPANRPNNSSENVFIISDWRVPEYPNSTYTLGCFEIQSGSLNVNVNRTLTIIGDYFKNIHTGSLNVNPANTWEVRMQGSGDQDFTNVDSIPRLRINNANTVNITKNFSITSRFLIDAGSGIINIDEGMSVLSSAGNVTIPALSTVVVKSGATFSIDRNLTIAGVLKIEAGGRLLMGNARNLTVASGGLLHLDGSPGSIASIDSTSGSYNFNVIGDVNLNYFSISRTRTAGMNVTGTIQTMNNGDFHYIASSGRAITLGASASSPSTISKVGFFEEGAAGTQFNVQANAYTGSVIAFDEYSGIGGDVNESDPSNKINWASAADAKIQITDSSPPGIPATSINTGTADSHIASFSFAMSASAPVASDITMIKLTLGGSNLASDLDNIKVIKDTNSNCTYEPGTDTQIGSTLYPSGSPASATLNLTASTLSVIDTTQQCIHILGSVNSTAQSGNTISIRVASTEDVENSEDYEWSISGSPPLEAGSFTIAGSATKVWNGGYSGGYANANDWTTSGLPNSTLNCQIGTGYSVCEFPNTTERSCLNINLQDSGALDFNNHALTFSAYGSIDIGAGYTFTQANNSTLALKGSSNQSINAQTNFPGSLNIQSSGGEVSLNTDWQISSDLTVTSGVFNITSGSTLTVLGDVVINGGSLNISPGGMLRLGNGSTLTVAPSGSLELIGNPSQSSLVSSINTSSGYSVVVNGTISANYYSFSNLGVNGVTVNAAATIDASNNMQNGSFSYPVSNGTTLLTLNRKVPSDTLDSMTFDANGSGVTSTQSIRTSTSAGTLTMSNYSGSMTGDAFSTNDPNYLVSWTSATNTIDLTQESTSPTSVNQGQTYTMGRFGFRQTTSGAFNDTQITSLVLTLIGTGDSADISALKLYYDSSCSGTGGVLIGSAGLTGSPAKATFSSLVGATIDAHPSASPKRCIYVVADIGSLATSAQTVGLQITSNIDVVNSESFAFNGSASPTVTLGSPSTIIGSTTIWTGSVSSDWSNPANWSSGVPTQSINCIINNAPNDPVISGTVTCKSVTNGNGIISMNPGSTLEVYGSFENTGTFTQSGNTLVFKDNGITASTQDIKSSTPIESISFDKTAGGTIVFPAANLEITDKLEMGLGNDFILNIKTGSNVTLAGGLEVNAGTVDLKTAGLLKIGNGQTLLVNGGTFKTGGVNDAYPQSLSNKAKLQAASGSFAFSATSGNVNLKGFLIDGLDNNGLNFSGTTNILAIDGGQVTSLSTSYAAMKAIQFNNSGTKPSMVTNFGWQWDSVPENTQPYTLAYSSGCGGANISFDGWFGNWYEQTPTFDVNSKVSQSSCNITLDGSASPVSLTEFKATGYDKSVELKWSTGLEFRHKGFNVYRSLSEQLGYSQINSKLIRNDNYSDSIHGDYIFHDKDLDNDTTYYYMLEDISVSGARKWHGPIYATTNKLIGQIPSPGSDVIFNQTNEDHSERPGQGQDTNQTQIAEGIEILSQTSSALRIRIDVPMYEQEIDTGSGFSDITIKGYSLSHNSGQAKLPYKSVLLNIENASRASYKIVSQQQTQNSPISITPALRYIQSNNKLDSEFYKDFNWYSTDNFMPESVLTLGEINKSILPITINPISYNPHLNTIKFTSQIIVDIFLDGQTDWQQNQLGKSLWSTDGGLKIGIKNKGVYSLSYTELKQRFVDYPFESAHINDLKLYLKDIELPIKINSHDDLFNDGDTIVFYSPQIKSNNSTHTHLLLINDIDSNNGLRMQEQSYAPRDESNSGSNGFLTSVHFEQNHHSYFREPYSEQEDHITWARFYSPPINAGDDFFTHDVDLSDIVQEGDVQIHALLKGSRLGNYNNFTHHVSLWVNENKTDVSVTFKTEDPYYAIFTLPAKNFSPGINRIQLQAMGTYINSTDLVDIDYFKIIYKKNFSAIEDKLKLNIYDYQLNTTINNFSSGNIIGLDISNVSDIKYMTDMITKNTELNYELSFNQKNSRRFTFTDHSALQKVNELNLISGSDLTNTNNEANILYIGTKQLLNSIHPLADFRRDQGHSYKLITIESIFNEFNHGLASPEAIKDFIEYAYNNWRQKPEYIVLVGDSTFDPKGEISSIPANSIPLKLLKGRFYDYASDNWFVSFNNSLLPTLAIGRIPGNYPSEISSYVDKVISYESGQEHNNTIELVIDKDQDQSNPEGFNVKADKLSDLIKGLAPQSNIKDIRRSDITNLEMQSSISDAFNDSSSIIHYLGHGAEDMWASYDVFTNQQAGQLNNSSYPLVIAMNCLNAYFYSSDQEDKSLAEAVVLKPSGGAIAFWGSTSLTSPSSQQPYQEEFYKNLLTTNSTLGEAIRLTKLKIGSQGDKEVLNSWTLIGDPLLNIKINRELPEPVRSFISAGKSSSGGGCSMISVLKDWKVALLEYLILVLFMIGIRKVLNKKSS